MNTKVRSFKDRRRRKKGVSPVIGVILMVAATIVIAAVVLAMLGGFTAPGRQYVVMATAQENATSYIHVTYTGGPDATLVSHVNCSIDGTDVTDAAFYDATVGSSVGAAGTAGARNNHVTVTAIFTDTSEQVILDTFV